jgi:hypothetical protein
MKKNLNIFCLFVIFACSNGQLPDQVESAYFDIEDFSPTDTLFRVAPKEYELGAPFCYVNQQGDTIIPYGRFVQSFSDTIVTYGIVVEKTEDKFDLIGINQKGQRLYDVHWFDNGPDYLEEGLFRILRNGKTGFADSTGKIVIEPQFDCAFPFSNGRAKVAYDCAFEKDLDHITMKSDHWIFIDKTGKEIR